MRPFHTIFLVLCLTLSFGGCKNVKSYLFEEEDDEFIEDVKIIADPHMNRGYPLRFDLVIIKHPELVKHIEKLNAKQFLRQRKQLKHDHPKFLKIKSFEVIPGQSMSIPLKYQKREVSAAFVFADFSNGDINRWRVFSADHVTLHLLQRTLKITSHADGVPEKMKINDADKGVIFVKQ